MRKDKQNTDSGKQAKLTVVEVGNPALLVEFEIQRHVKSIRALIKKLRPHDRQKYYDGLLSHMLTRGGDGMMQKAQSKGDFSNLNDKDLLLIRELSGKIEELYFLSGNQSPD
jgi:hypothetical protein